MTEPKKEAIEPQFTIVPDDPKTTIDVLPFGSDERIKLSIKIVRDIIAVPTRTGKLPSDKDCIKFMMLCRARHLNPFEGDCFMLGYDGQGGSQFSLITAHQVFLKRAEASKGFNGMESGVIVERKPERNMNIGATTPMPDKVIFEREGDLVYDDEKLIGGWAKVFRKDREKPFYRRLKLSVFNTGRSRWEKDPAGMICKCAEADALRTAFPTHLGGLYIEEEPQPIDVEAPLIKRALVPKLKDKDLPVPVQDGSQSDKYEAHSDSVEASTDTGGKPESNAVRHAVNSRDSADASSGQDSKKKPSAKLQRKTKPVLSSNRAAMMGLLSEIGSNAERFMELAQSPECEWLPKDATWDSLTEEDLERFLTQDNRVVVIEALAK